MTYSFVCPFPCDQKIKVDAYDQDDAINKIITLGAIRCHNRDYHCSCEKARFDMSPMPPEELRNIVSLCMQEL